MEEVASSTTSTTDGAFEIFVGKEDFKFHCAHFVAFHGYRERLHGHNYSVAIRLAGRLNEDGYVLDFGDVKKATRTVCKELNEHFLCPCSSDVLTIKEDDASQQVDIRCQDGSFFSFPRGDCYMLPITHSTAEELAAYMWRRLLGMFGAKLRDRGVHLMEVIVSEAARQSAAYRRSIPASPEGDAAACAEPPRPDPPAPEACCLDRRVDEPTSEADEPASKRQRGAGAAGGSRLQAGAAEHAGGATGT